MLARVNETRRVPVLVVSGFLGSGKTTLVRHLLADAQRSGRRAAVVSNEFADLGIDGALLDRAGDAYVELSGGCVCCRLADDLVETLQRLRERVDPDLVIVETSGVALPFDVQLNLWREPIADWIESDVAVVVVDAEQVAQGRELDGTFAQQVSSADLLLLNKLDLVAAQALPEIEAALRAIEPDAPLIRAVQAQVDPALLFPPDPDGVRKRRRSAPIGRPPHQHESFAAEVLLVADAVEPKELLERVRTLAPLRAKGFVLTSEGPRILQGVGPRIELSKLEFSPPADLLGRIVLIRRIDA
jgi:cobalamin biosynthesis protein CobW